MIKKIFYILLSTIFVFQTAYASKEIKVGFALSEAPFIMDDNKTGIIVSLAEEAFKRAGYTIIKNFMPNKRLPIELENGDLDASMSIPKDSSKIHYSDVFVYFDNYAVTKKSRKIRIDSMKDLKGKTLVSWHNAPVDLDDKDFMRMYKDNDFSLKEMPKQNMQVKAFLSDRFEVIIIDKKILHYLSKKIQKELNLPNKDLEFDYNKVFSKHTGLYSGFSSSELRDKFNQALDSMRKDGTYDKIVESFLNF